MPTSWVDRLQLSEASTRLLAVNGTEIEVSGQLQQSVIVGNQRTTATFLANPNFRVAVGIGWLTENHVTWVFVVGQQRVVPREKPRRPKHHRQRVARSDGKGLFPK